MQLYSYLISSFPKLKIERDFSFARHTTIGLGGTAAAATYPRTVEEAEELIRFLVRNRIPYCFLGAGANVLPPNRDFQGVVIKFSRFDALYFTREGLYAGAGVTGGRLCRFARENGVGGFEPFTGIPMTVGGGAVMNAGVAAGHISDVALRVYGIKDGELKIFSQEACRFAEKSSVFQNKIAVVGVLFRAEKREEKEIISRTDRFQAHRRSLPKGRSMGCVFVNPDGESAGRLIDECGLKGAFVGGAHVSRIHANFIINDGGTAEDISNLISHVKEEVFRKKGILLKEEIRRLPD